MVPYIRCLLELNGRDWQRLQTNHEVYEFWFSLAHMSPWQRAVAAAEVTGLSCKQVPQYSRMGFLMELASQVVEMIEATKFGEMADRQRAGNLLRDRVQRLTVIQAVRLVAIAERGRARDAEVPIEQLAHELRARFQHAGEVLAYLLDDHVADWLEQGLRQLEK